MGIPMLRYDNVGSQLVNIDLSGNFHFESSEYYKSGPFMLQFIINMVSTQPHLTVALEMY